jgi:hypothetical protein
MPKPKVKTQAIARGRLALVATRHPPDDTDELARFGTAIRAKIGERTAAGIARYLWKAPRVRPPEEESQ